jgi:hypothetical protein
MLDVLTAGGGVVIIGAVVIEVFKDLFQPTDSGALSDWVGRRLFNLFRRRRPMLPMAGPLALVAVIGSWVVLLMLGFGLVYYAGFPDQFRTGTGAMPSQSPRYLSALYISFETLITLGYGDIVPHSMTMRFVATTESLIGFGLLTASVSSIVLIYPALSRTRLLARAVSHTVAAERETGLSTADSGSDAVLAAFARDVTLVRIDLVHFPIIYYFAPNDNHASVACWVAELTRMAREGLALHAPKHVRLSAGALDKALDDLAALLAKRFVRIDPVDRDAVFRAFARDQSITAA